MGDDVVAHARVVDVPDDASLDQLFRLTAPEITVSAASTWVCTWNGVPVALQTPRWGTGRVWDDRYAAVSDLPGTTASPTLTHEYWSRMDGDWLLAQLRSGAQLDRRVLTERWAPLAAARREQELRERELLTTERLLDPVTVAALEGFGARTDLHTDGTCRFVLDASVVAPGQEEAAGTWTVERADTMTVVRGPHRREGSIRPVAPARSWLVALVGAAVTGRGPDALPAQVADSAVRYSPGLRRPPGSQVFPGLWTVTRHVGERQELAQLHDPARAEWFRRTLGLSVHDVAAAYGLQIPAGDVEPVGAAPAAAPGPEPRTGRLARWARRLLGRRT